MALHPMDMLRLSHIFTQQPSPTFAGGGTPPVTPQGDGMQTLGLEHGAIDRFNQLINNYPQQNKPGLLRKIFGTVAGTLSGPDAEENVLHPGYKGAVENWQNQIKPLQEAANLERQSNANISTLKHQTESEKRLSDASLRSDQNADERLTRQINADRINEQLKQTHEDNLIKMFNEGAINRKQLEDAKASYAKELEALKATHAKELEAAKAGHAVDLAGFKTGETIKVNTFKGQQIKESQLEVQRRRMNNVDQLKRLHPEWANFVSIDPNTKEIKVAPANPNAMFQRNRLSQADYEAINKFIDENGTTSTQSTEVNAPPEFGREQGITKGTNGKYTWKTEHGSFEWDGKGWIKVG